MIFREHRAKDRYVAALVAQAGGLCILALNYIIFSRGPSETATGVSWIFWAGVLYLSASIPCRLPVCASGSSKEKGRTRPRLS